MKSNLAKRAALRMKRVAKEYSKKTKVWAASKHLSGPRKIKLAEDEVALVCMLKNGSYYLDVLLEHHRALGIRHFLFIDNGSDDDTIAKLVLHSDVTVISNKLPVAEYESAIRADSARRVFKGGWFLFVDSDELIELTNGENRNIKDYLKYCNEHGYDAVITQCLDMFSSFPISETQAWSYARSIKEFNLFSLENINDFNYHDENLVFSWFIKNNVVSNLDIKIKFGGIRQELFGENCGLSSHRLVKNSDHIRIYSHPHCSSNVHCADFSILLRHYKFSGNYLDRERRQVRNQTWKHGEDRIRLNVLNESSFVFVAKNAQYFTGTGSLLEQKFLTGSSRFLAHFPSSE